MKAKKYFKPSSYVMEYYVANHFDWRKNVICANVSWGLLRHEADLLICSKALICTEVEIKISKADLKADFKKRMGHRDERIKYLYYAIPEHMMDCVDLIPELNGVLVLTTERQGYSGQIRHEIKVIRKARPSSWYLRDLNNDEYSKLLRLANLRYWSNFCVKPSREYRNQQLEIGLMHPDVAYVQQTTDDLLAAIESITQSIIENKPLTRHDMFGIKSLASKYKNLCEESQQNHPLWAN